MERQVVGGNALVVGTDGPDFTVLNDTVLGLLAQVRAARTKEQAETLMGDVVSVALEGVEEVPGALAGVLRGISKALEDWAPRVISAEETYQEHALLQRVRDQVLQYLSWGVSQVTGTTNRGLYGVYVPGLYRQVGGQVHVRGSWVNPTGARVALAEGYSTVANGWAEGISLAPCSVLLQTRQGDAYSFASYLGGRPNTMVAYLAHRGSPHLEAAKALWEQYRAQLAQAEVEAHLRCLEREEEGDYGDPSPQ